MILMILLTLAGSPINGTAEETVFVHEWGVVSVDEIIPVAQGAHPGYLGENGMLEPFYSLEVDAPVIWFHGPEFTGTLTVEVQNGYFSLLIPNPAAASAGDEPIAVFPEGDNYTAVWKELRFTDDLPVRDESSYDRRGITDESAENGFEWAMPFWREVPALTVTYGAASYTDRFIYYECSAANLTDLLGPSENYLQGSLVFRAEEGVLAAEFAVAPRERVRMELTISDEGILEVLRGWGDDEFLDEEIDALWKTWKPSILTRCVQNGEVIVLFPLTDEQVESISTLNLETDQGYNVQYSRLFLAMGSI
ncbi:MAG: hypothetical protein ABFR50_04575 [Candidatus Fermentibacteria bacterium]